MDHIYFVGPILANASASPGRYSIRRWLLLPYRKVPYISFSIHSGLGILLYGLIVYIQYYVYFKKNFGPFKQEFLKGYKPKFWSWNFWKPYLLISAAGSFLGLILPANIASGISFIFLIFLQHICIHGENWGFVLVPKQQPALEKNS